MVGVLCGSCYSKDVNLDGAEKYLVCNKCGERVYVRDLDMGFDNIDFASILSIRMEVEEKLNKSRGDKVIEDICKSQLEIIDRCISSI